MSCQEFFLALFLVALPVGVCSAQEISAPPQRLHAPQPSSVTLPVPVLPKSLTPPVRRDRYIQPVQAVTPTLAPASAANTEDFFIDTKSNSPLAWTFDQVISAMLTGDPKLRVGKEDIRQAKAEYCTSSLLPNPELTMEGAAFPFKPTKRGEYTGGPPEMNFNVEFPIDWFLFAKRKAEMNSARWEVRQAQAEYADLIRERIAETAITFYDVLEAKALLDIVRQDLEFSTRLEKMTKDGVTEGGIPSVEWKRITLELLQIRQELVETEKALDILKVQLRSQFGCTDYDPTFDITGSLDVPVDLDLMPLEAAFETARQNRPDIRALRMGIGKAKANVLVEKKNAYPEVMLGAGFGR